MAFISPLVVSRLLQEDLIDLPKIVMFITFHLFIYFFICLWDSWSFFTGSSTAVWLYFFCWTQNTIFWKQCREPKQLLVAIDFHSMQKKWFGMSRWWQNFHFWLNYPFKEFSLRHFKRFIQLKMPAALLKTASCGRLRALWRRSV